jgi:hypothetical protein
MANPIKWSGAGTSRGTVLTTELNTLANAGYSGLGGTEIDNTTNLDQWAQFHIHLASLNPTAGAYLTLYLVNCIASTYEDAPSSTNPGFGMAIWSGSVATGSAAKEIATPPIRIPPGKFKFVLKNNTNVSLGGSGNTVTMYTANDQLP